MRTLSRGLVLLGVLLSVSGAHAAAAAAAPAAQPTLLQSLKKTVTGLQDTIAPGVAGRLTSVAVLHPLDTIKTRAQLVATSSRRTMETVLYRGRGAYFGLGPALIGQVPHGLITCVAFEMWSDWLKTKFPKLEGQAKTVASVVLSDLTGLVWLAPMEMVKTQLQARMANSFPQAAGRVARSGIRGWATAFEGQLARDVPFRVIQLLLYSELSKMFAKTKEDGRLSLAEAIGTGTVAGCLTAGITAPLDAVRTRMMTTSGMGPFAFLPVMKKFFEKEGAGFFMPGLTPRLLYVGASSVAFLAVYDAVARARIGQKSQ